MSEFNDLEFMEVEVASILAAQIVGKSSPDPSDIAQAMSAAFDALMAFVETGQLIPAGPPRSIYTSYDPDGVRFVVAVPVVQPGGELKTEGPGSVEPIAGGSAMRFTHRGPYNGLMKTYGRITEFLKAQGFMQSEADWLKYMPMWEEYLNDPHTTPEADLLTYIYLPKV